MSIHLLSCGNCGVVLDAHKLQFPDDIDPIYHEGVPNTHKIYNSEDEEWVYFVPCPVCQNPISQPV